MLNSRLHSWSLKFELWRDWYAFGNWTTNLVIQSASFADSGCVKTRVKNTGVKNNFALAGHFFCTFLCLSFARRERETTSNFFVTRFMEENVVCVPVYFFFFTPPLIFTLVAANISHFLIHRYEIFMFSSIEIGLLCFLTLALALSLFSRPM